MECSNLDEVRANIDRLDRQIVSLLAERGNYVLQAAKFKPKIDDVSAPQRVEAVIRNVRRIAVETGALPDVVEETYRTLIAALIQAERTEYQRLQSNKSSE
jgi:isochorismate pyruvate lyase